jgi:hypothetical protein
MRNSAIVMVMPLLLLVWVTTVGRADSQVWARLMGVPPQATPDLGSEIATGRELDDERYHLLERTAFKRGLVAEVTAGRLSLAEATDGFLAVDEGNPQSLATLRRLLPGRSDREREARSVLAWARCGEAPQFDLGARLDAEFRILFPAESSD